MPTPAQIAVCFALFTLITEIQYSFAYIILCVKQVGNLIIMDDDVADIESN